MSLSRLPETNPADFQSFQSLETHLIARYQDQALHGFAERVPEFVTHLLDKADLNLSDLGALAVATGPGSFTGIRSSLAFLRGLAQACNLPLYATTSFDGWQAALHLSLGISLESAPETCCLIALDTRRQDAYISFRTARGQSYFPDTTATPDQLYQILADRSDLPARIYLIGDICQPYQQALHKLDCDIICPDLSFSSADGLIAQAIITRHKGQITDMSALPYYIRPAEAKLPRLPGLQQLGLALSTDQDT